jgi:hypothetical protein
MHVDPATLTCLKMPAPWAAWAAKVSSSFLHSDTCGAAGPSTCAPSYNSHTQLLLQHRAEAKLRRLHTALFGTEEDTRTTLVQTLQHAVFKLASFCKRHGTAAVTTLFNRLQQVQPAAAAVAATDISTPVIQTLQHAVFRLASFCKGHGTAAAASLFNCVQTLQQEALALGSLPVKAQLLLAVIALVAGHTVVVLLKVVLVVANLCIMLVSRHRWYRNMKRKVQRRLRNAMTKKATGFFGKKNKVSLTNWPS